MLDDAFVTNYKNEIQKLPKWNRPSLGEIVSNPQRSLQRKWLSKIGLLLEEQQRKTILGKLKNDRHFLATYNELAVMSLMESSGLSVKYEPVFESSNKKLTPDFALYLPNGDLAALVEVSTRFRTTEQRNLENQWKELIGRVRQIPIPFGIAVQNLGPSPTVPPDSRTAKRIAQGLQSWLGCISTENGSVKIIEGYGFHIIANLPGRFADLVAPNGGIFVNSDNILGAISNKSDKYASLADELEVPLIVIIAAEPFLPFGITGVRDALSGKYILTMSCDPFVTGSITYEPMPIKEPGAPMEFHKALSLVGWLEPEKNNPGTLTMFNIPSAARSLSFSFSEGINYDNNQNE